MEIIRDNWGVRRGARKERGLGVGAGLETTKEGEV
jgi:hypothetical protein